MTLEILPTTLVTILPQSRSDEETRFVYKRLKHESTRLEKNINHRDFPRWQALERGSAGW